MKHALIIPLLILCMAHPAVSQQTGIEVLQVHASVQIGGNEGNAQFILKSQLINEIIPTSFEVTIPNKYFDIIVRIEKQIVPIRVSVHNGWTSIEITPITSINQGQTFIIEITAKFNPENTKTEAGTNLLRFDWGINYPVNSFTIQITLPYGAVLTTQQGNPNLFPSTASLDTNGTHVTLSWLNLTYAEPNNIQTVIVEFQEYNNEEKSQNNIWTLLVGIFIGMGLTVAFTWAAMKARGIDPKTIATKIEAPQTEIQIKTIYKPIVLKPQQVRILELIKENEPLQQSTLIDFMGLSKSRVSQYLKELEEQNLIVREKDGKENLVFLKQDVEL